MTVSSSTNKVSYSGNGSLTTFAYTFKIFDQGDLTVILRAADGTETTQTITTHYTVSGVGSASGGNVVFGSAPASGVTVVIIREQPLTQGLDLVANDPFPAESLEEALDKLVFMSQKHEEELSRAIKGSRTNVISNSEFTVSATDRANKVFSFDASGNLSIAQELGTFKGNWATSTTYVARDIVKDTSTNNIFIVNADHTSSGAQPLTTNANSAKYDLIVDAASSTTAQTAAAASAATATTKASEAATSATASETAKTASETAKTASETAKAASETAQAASEAALDSFDDRYLGAKSTSGGLPTQDNDGNALIDGALFFDTTNNVLMVYNLGTTTWLRTTPTSSDQTKINTVNSSISNVNTVAGISANVTTVAGISANVTTVAGQTTNLQNVTDNLSAIQNAGTNATNAASSATAAASSQTAAAASQVAAAASASSAASSFDSFDDRYLGVKSSDPTTDNDGDALASGMLYFSSSENIMKVYDGASWIAATSAGNVSLTTFQYTATGGQTTFSGSDDNSATLSYTVNNILVTLNGSLLFNGTDYTASNGTSVVLASGAVASDVLQVTAFKSFTTADMVPASTGGTFSGNVTVSGDVKINNGGTHVGSIKNVSSDFVIQSIISDQNIIFKGNDGGSVINALSLDMSENGVANFAAGANFEGDISITAATNARLTINDNVGEVGSGNLAFQAQNSAASALKPMGFRAEDIRFATGSAERMRVTSDGDVGIGAANPGGSRLYLQDTHTTTVTDASTLIGNTTLTINGNSTQGSDVLRIGPMDNAGAHFIDVSNSGGSAAYSLCLNPIKGGNVGIGVLVPNAKLDIMGQGTSSTNLSMLIGADEGGSVSPSRTDATDKAVRIGMPHRTNAEEPAALLTASSTSSDNTIMIGGGTSVMNAATNIRFITGANTTTTSGSERMRISADGDLLLGATAAFTDGSNNNAGAGGICVATASGNAGCLNLKLTGGNGTIARFIRGGQANGGVVGTISITTTSTAYNTSSDYRLKENVVDLTGATTRLKQLEPKRFNFIADANTTVDGFLAHEVQTVVPEAITGTHNEVDDDGNAVMQGIDQSKLVPLLVATIKELEARITALEGA